MKNEMELFFDAKSENEGFARVAVAAFAAGLNPTLEELADIKTAVSEAVTNSIIHGYGEMDGKTQSGIPKQEKQGQSKQSCECAGSQTEGNSRLEETNLRSLYGKIRIWCSIEEDRLEVEIEDYGKGIEDVKQAMEPLFTTRPDLERSGMGFAFMEAFMDELVVKSEPGKGTRIHMEKTIGAIEWIDEED